ncbi:hypothetical protein CDL12_28820 [Handroanthus impetiginosus]|uniref:Uncharacterized protein n=1 Tax=Handroanthus impetiginosus TaxID=429701 RepID=A0A2G9G039_9LAMI|nr:hypothetical protein CDL12_28820 [Handroanthus impetiginosus]
MATTIVTENYSFNTGLEDLNDIEFSNIDASFLMSLTEDSQIDDDERLRSVIQSLEAEILNQNSFLETNSEEKYQFSSIQQMESCCTSADHDQGHDFYFEGIDMEMPYYCSSADEMSSYFSCHFEDNVENMAEFGGLTDYSQVCYGMAMEEDDYSGLWQ